MDQGMWTYDNRLRRRRFLQVTGLGLGAISAATLVQACGSDDKEKAAGQATASQPGAASEAAGGKKLSGNLTFLMWSHFVPAYDKWFDEFATNWGKANNVNMRVDHIPHLELPARQAAEVAAQGGHDVIQFAGTAGPNLFQKHLEDQDELMGRLEKEKGGWEDTARNLAFVNGHWKVFPDFFIRFPVLYREDLFKQEALSAPETWEDLLNSGRKLKPKGHPGGIGYVANHVDANASARAILWSFGGKYVDKDGKTVALDSRETREALRFGKALFDEAMTPEVLAWDDSANNRFLASGKGAWIHNPISAYLSIKPENPELFKNINIALTPKGPADRRTGVSPNTFGIWKFANNKDAARAFLSHYADSWMEGFRASNGYNHPMLKGWATKPMPILGDGDDPKLRILQDFAPLAGFMGWPGPVTPAADEVWQTFLIPQMFGKVVQGKSIDDAIKETEAAIKKVYDKHKS